MLYLIRAPQYKGRPEKKIADWIIEDWEKMKVEFEVLGADVEETIKSGVFYDNFSSIHSYIRAVQSILHKIKDGDKLFFIEGWNPSIPLIKLYIDTEGLNVQMYGIFHSSVNTPGELFSEYEWVQNYENTLVDMFTSVFVATNYLKNKIVDKENKVKVTGLPFPRDVLDIKTKPFKERKPIVVFNHRWTKDKRPEEFEHLAKAFGDQAEFWLLTPRNVNINNPDIKVVYNDSREEYLNNLKKARVVFSSAQLETFGYSVLEGVMLGCAPFLAGLSCYSEMYPKEFIYGTRDDLLRKFPKVLNGVKTDPMKDLEPYKNASKNIFKLIQNENLHIGNRVVSGYSS